MAVRRIFAQALPAMVDPSSDRFRETRTGCMIRLFNMRALAALVIVGAGDRNDALELPIGGTAQAGPTQQSQIRPALPQPVPTPHPGGNVKPAIIATTALAGFTDLSAARQKLIKTALAVATDSPWLPYVPGGADPAQGGLDCSGAMYCVLTRCGLSPPRTSAGQYAWLRDHGQLHLVADEATTADDPSLAGLRPGDLLFWATGQQAEDVKIPNITHVAMYLGRQTGDGLRVMINASDGRSYRGVRSNGYGVYDFRMPQADSKSKLVGYGPPPGMVARRLPGFRNRADGVAGKTSGK